jgi:hypothetical protein
MDTENMMGEKRRYNTIIQIDTDVVENNIITGAEQKKKRRRQK